MSINTKLNIRSVKISDLKMAKYNPRKDLKPGDDEYEKLKRSMEAHDYVDPIVWNERTGNVVGGHQRLKVLIADGATEVDVSVVNKSLSDEKALNIALNKISGAWDDDKLADLLQGLKAEDYDIGLTGFDEDELNDLLGISAGEVTEDEVPEPPAEPVSKRGEIYELGDHRLMCGDSTSKADVAALIGGGRQADICFTSPPYGIGENSLIRNNVKDPRKITSFYNAHDDNPEEWPELMRNWWDTIRPCVGAVICNVQMLANNKRPLIEWINEHVEDLCDIAIWDKGNGTPALAKNVLTARYEFLLVFGGNATRSIPFANFKGDISNIVDIAKGHNDFSDIHKAVFPVALPSWVIGTLCAKAKTILDPFGGSGTTLIAAEQLGRTCYMMELDPRYVDVIIQRWETLTGGKAKKIQEGVE